MSIRQEIDICVHKYTYDVVGIPWEVKQLDTQSAAVFTNLIKEESYPQFEVRAMLLGEKGTGKTTVARFLVYFSTYLLFGLLVNKSFPNTNQQLLTLFTIQPFICLSVNTLKFDISNLMLCS
jgi:hypothetical protein